MVEAENLKRKKENLKNVLIYNMRIKKTRKNYYSSPHSIQQFENEITVYFFEILLMIKLFHWKTFHYATHKATDQLYEKLNGHMDRFIEVLLGKTTVRMDFKHKKTISLLDVSREELLTRIKNFKKYLVNLSTQFTMKNMTNFDLLTIRDEILADLNQFLYLMFLK